MMPIVRAIELEVPVIGRSYSPAFLGWFSAMRNSFTRDYKRSFYPWVHQPSVRVAQVAVTQGIGIAVTQRQFLCQISLLPFVKQLFVSLSRGNTCKMAVECVREMEKGVL